MKVEMIFLDVGGIILEIQWKRTLDALGLHGEALQKAALEKVRDWTILHRFERGHVAVADFFREFRQLLELRDETDAESAFNQLIVGPLPGAERIFQKYKGMVPLCALSNTNHAHHSYQMRRFPILSRFDHFLTSHELGHRKPDRGIYLAAATRMGVRPDQAIFIDDSAENVATAAGLGFRAFRTVNSPDLTIAVLDRELGA